MSGQCTGVADGKVQLQSATGNFVVQTDGAVGMQPGAEATFVIAADLVTISRDIPATGNENGVQATLISEEFIGSVVTLFLETGNGTEFKVQLQERELAKLDIATGGDFYLRWNSEDAHLLQQGTSAGQ